MRPVLEQQPTLIYEAIEARAIVAPEATPYRQVMGAIEHVDRVELHAADVFDEANQTAGAERVTARPRQMLALEEERPDSVQRDGLQRESVRDGAE